MDARGDAKLHLLSPRKHLAARRRRRRRRPLAGEGGLRDRREGGRAPAERRPSLGVG
jgi:hypothetical protein